MRELGLVCTMLVLALSTAGCADVRAMLTRIAAPIGVLGSNRTVSACQEAVQERAVRFGASTVEAVSAGPDHVNAKGEIVGPVWVRITYERPKGLEVREALLTCVVDRQGAFITAAST